MEFQELMRPGEANSHSSVRTDGAFHQWRQDKPRLLLMGSYTIRWDITKQTIILASSTCIALFTQANAAQGEARRYLPKQTAFRSFKRNHPICTACRCLVAPAKTRA